MPRKPPPRPLVPLLTTDDLVILLSVKPKRVYDLCKREDNRLPHLRVGGFLRFDPADVAIWLDDQRAA